MLSSQIKSKQTNPSSKKKKCVFLCLPSLPGLGQCHCFTVARLARIPSRRARTCILRYNKQTNYCAEPTLLSPLVFKEKKNQDYFKIW